MRTNHSGPDHGRWPQKDNVMQGNRFSGKKSLNRQVRLNPLPAEPVKDKGGRPGRAAEVAVKGSDDPFATIVLALGSVRPPRQEGVPVILAYQRSENGISARFSAKLPGPQPVPAAITSSSCRGRRAYWHLIRPRYAATRPSRRTTRRRKEGAR